MGISELKFYKGGEFQRWDQKFSVDFDDGPHAHEAQLLQLDSSKARSLLGFAPIWSIESTLDRVVDWYKAYETQQNMLDFTKSQVGDFLDSLVS